MTIKISARVTYDKGIFQQEMLRELVALLEHPKPMWATIGKYLIENTLARFYKGIDPSGKKWISSSRVRKVKAFWKERPLLEAISATAFVRADSRVLIKSGALVNSIKYTSSDAGVSLFTAGLKKRYAMTHQEGRTGERAIKAKKKPYMHFKTPHGWVTVKQFNVPQRQFLGLSREDRAMIFKVASAYIQICFPMQGPKIAARNFTSRPPVKFPLPGD